ncbi:MAG: Rnf-Nqr domain containing protein [Angelakisella sp.]
MLGFYEYTANCTPKARQISTKLVYGFIPIGTLFIVGGGTYTLIESIVYGTGAGLGYILATLLNYCMQKRLAHSDIPVAFRGMPATLLSFGMISLALFGLLGHQLAV